MTTPLDRPPGVYPDGDWRLIEAFHRRNQALRVLDAEAARLIGYKSASSWLTLREGKYGADPGNILKAIRLFLEGQAAKAAAVTSAPDTELDVTADIHAYCDGRRDRACMGFVCGAPGIGKSVAIRLYAAARDNVFVVSCPAGITPRFLLKAIAEQVHVTIKDNMSRVDALDRVASKLAGTPRAILLIDEADRLKEAAETARDLWRETGQCGHVWFGTKAFWEGLNRRFASSAGQIARRFGDVLFVATMTEDDVERILSHYPWPQAILSRARDHCRLNTGRLCDGLAAAERFARKESLTVPTLAQIDSAFHALATTSS